MAKSAVRAQRIPVVVVGAGPTGLAASLFLQRKGIRHVVLERRSALHAAPQAHVLKTRTLEIYRKLGLDTAIIERATPVAETRFINWFSSLSASFLASLDLQHIRSGAATRDLSPTRAANLPQDELEQLLFDAASRNACDVRFNTDVTSARNYGDFAVVLATNRETGEAIAFEADYVVAADGASSSVRRGLGINMSGETAIASFVAIYFHSDLSRFFNERPGLVNWGLHPDARGTLIVHGMRKRSVFMHEYDPTRERLEDFTPARCSALVRRMIGAADHPFEIQSVGGWTMTAQIAESYSKERIFLIGDAAHRFPPTGGLGLNTGAQDVFNLIWKLDLVLRGRAGPALLQTYEAECRPVATANCSQSLRNQLRNTEVAQALRLNGEPEHDRGILAACAAADSAGAQLREAASIAAVGQTPHYVSLGLDLGFCYQSSAVIDDGSPPSEQNSTTYTPSCRPGARLPHCWLTGPSGRASTLDLATDDGFTLFTGEESDVWVRLAAQASAALSIPIQVVAVGDGPGMYRDGEGRWRQLRGHEEAGAVLVRPDGHVAWRCSDAPMVATENGLARALRQIVALETQLAMGAP